MRIEAGHRHTEQVGGQTNGLGIRQQERSRTSKATHEQPQLKNHVIAWRKHLSIPDPDDGPDKNDAGPEVALSTKDQSEADAESERIKENKKLPAAAGPHKFRPARFTQGWNPP